MVDGHWIVARWLGQGWLFGEQAGQVPFWPFLVLIVIAFYVLLIRPEMASNKRHREMLKNLKQGDEVVTIGGIFGRIVSLDEEKVVIRVDDNARLRILRSAIARKVSEEKKADSA